MTLTTVACTCSEVACIVEVEESAWSTSTTVDTVAWTHATFRSSCRPIQDSSGGDIGAMADFRLSMVLASLAEPRAGLIRCRTTSGIPSKTSLKCTVANRHDVRTSVLRCPQYRHGELGAPASYELMTLANGDPQLSQRRVRMGARLSGFRVTMANFRST